MPTTQERKPWWSTGEPLTDAIRKANFEDGHLMVIDPPAGLTSVTRWTCVRPNCGRAILRAEHSGPVYGSATEYECKGDREQ